MSARPRLALTLGANGAAAVAAAPAPPARPASAVGGALPGTCFLPSPGGLPLAVAQPLSCWLPALKAAARQGYEAFQATYVRVVPASVRVRLEALAPVRSLYLLFRVLP